MTDPLEPPPPPRPPEPGRRTEVPAEPVPAAADDPDAMLASSEASPALQGPMREIAAAFRMNAEALHTLKQMQVELAANVKRGDRSELVLQSTRALNDTFRNLSTVQRELLTRLDSPGGSRGPLVPLMLLGLLIVFVAGIYVILTELQETKSAKPAVDPTEIVQRERDSWKEGRREGAQQSEREIQRLSEALEEAKDRARNLQQDLDAKTDDLNKTDRARRTAELERDEFAGQVRQAQGEVMAKKALEDEIHTLRSEKKSTDREVTDLEIALERKRKEAAWLRQRLADYGMDLPSDDPPYVAPGTEPDGAAAAKPGPSRQPKSKYENLLTIGRKKIEEQGKAEGGGTPPSRVPTSSFPILPGPGANRTPSAAEPGELPPPIMRRRGGMDRNATEVQRVRSRLNRLLDTTPSPDGQSWQITRIDGVSQSGLGGVILLRYNESGRMIDGIEAKDLRITFNREMRRVEFDLVNGVRVGQNRRVPLPPQGAKVIVAEGDATSAWASSGLTMIRKK